MKMLLILGMIAAAQTLSVAEAQSNTLTSAQVEAFYQSLWVELALNFPDKAHKPQLTTIKDTAVQSELTGKWMFSYDDNAEDEPAKQISVAITADKWRTNELHGEQDSTEEGFWKLFTDKIVLFRPSGDLRAFIVKVDQDWYWCDADLQAGIAKLRKNDG